MLESPTDSSAPPTTVKRYAPPNQRNRVHNRRKSGDRLERTSISYSNDEEKNQTSSRNTSNHLNENAPPRLIALNRCCSSEAVQLLNDRMHVPTFLLIHFTLFMLPFSEFAIVFSWSYLGVPLHYLMKHHSF
ncbi:uncharacterized protein LOC122069239 [Macadamia integrifolia]|uniref:uncharacterized protein LOC122069239 n=1 Tax=Macadamia integrifolia TaxID=60698 RepID=UPI001C4FDE6E|nr:uncharacterized protein LOC122069239 [Macadamia integrifolia]